MTKAHIQKEFSNQAILFGFTTTFIIFQKSNKVKNQRKIETYHKNQIIQSLAKEIIPITHTISNKAVNFTQKLNQAIIQIKNKYQLEKSFQAFTDK
ncbi:MAG: hypothetical protein LBC61_03795 [Candidatus Peribacteria bacterium]|jgi:tRNA U34 5-methylaminomethyl-2-thiouridine-forming methyltransferase MnmC|nr:hypothetical protein [Candidatus Peribacteria bacterium]